MDLLCAEKLSTECYAAKDSVVFEDDRVMRELLKLEHMYVPARDYFQTVQTDTMPYMRKIVTKWMLEVCDELNCEDQVFPLAVNILDRFLCTCDTPSKFLQLVAADCILIASKIRQAVIITIDTLCCFTNYSVTASQMRSYELLMVSKLNWDLSAITGFDFIDHILQRIRCSKHGNMIRRHALTLLHLCCTENEFMRVNPSTLATACIISAINGLKIKLDCDAFAQICSFTSSSVNVVENMVTTIEWIVSKEAAILDNQNQNAKNACQTGCGKMTPVDTDPTNVHHI